MAPEKNNHHSDVERRRDGPVFGRIGPAPGYGRASVAHDYAYSDADADAAEDGGGRQTGVLEAANGSPVENSPPIKGHWATFFPQPAISSLLRYKKHIYSNP